MRDFDKEIAEAQAKVEELKRAKHASIKRYSIDEVIDINDWVLYEAIRDLAEVSSATFTVERSVYDVVYGQNSYEGELTIRGVFTESALKELESIDDEDSDIQE